MVFRSLYCGFHPSTRMAFSEEAISWAGSPARRGATLAGIGCPGDRSGHVHHLFDGEADAVAQIKDVVLPALHQVIQRQNVRLGQVVDMDVVAHTGAVLGGIVVAGRC